LPAASQFSLKRISATTSFSRKQGGRSNWSCTALLTLPRRRSRSRLFHDWIGCLRKSARCDRLPTWQETDAYVLRSIHRQPAALGWRVSSKLSTAGALAQHNERSPLQCSDSIVLTKIGRIRNSSYVIKSVVPFLGGELSRWAVIFG
jgi:hypothetical protein